MKVRSLVLALAFAALGLSQTACSSLSRPDEILIAAEPAAAPAPPPPAPAMAPPAAPAQPAPGGGG